MRPLEIFLSNFGNQPLSEVYETQDIKNKLNEENIYTIKQKIENRKQKREKDEQ
ncbi:MAG: hypothetical protein U9N30_09300 [Campylobacterota bacterium]|nr:hypothetical protein [Campylobacterota bacterium]